VVESCPAFYYLLLGSHHAAYWHGQVPAGCPNVVTDSFYGVAVADWSIPFGTRLEIEVVGVPGWARQQYSHLIGRKVVAVVLDRMPRGWGTAIDCWPATFWALAGEDWRRIGKLYVRYREVKDGNLGQASDGVVCRTARIKGWPFLIPSTP